MATQREQDAGEYVKRHRIMELMEKLTSLLLYHRPENPREFLLEQLKQMKSGTCPSLFDSSDLDSVLRMMDPVNQGHITCTQYTHALKTLGIRDFDECPQGVNEDKISYETFKTEAMRGLQGGSAPPPPPQQQQQQQQL